MPPPRKKDRLRGSLSPVREQFSPTGTLYGGQVELSGKSCPDEGAKTAPGGRRGLCADCAHGETADIMCGVVPVSCRTLGARRGRGHARAQKQPPAGAGGCLDAGYGCYLPRAIRVIWMHRVGSTARPRIMPS